MMTCTTMVRVAATLGTMSEAELNDIANGFLYRVCSIAYFYSLYVPPPYGDGFALLLIRASRPIWALWLALAKQFWRAPHGGPPCGQSDFCRSAAGLL